MRVSTQLLFTDGTTFYDMDAGTFNINTTSFATVNTADIDTTATATMSRTTTTVYTATVLNINLSLPTRYSYHSRFTLVLPIE